jgi:uncharacterized protein (UPF0303 family)
MSTLSPEEKQALLYRVNEVAAHEDELRFPIRLTNSPAVIGAFALSGAHGEEHGFIVEMLRKFLGK